MKYTKALRIADAEWGHTHYKSIRISADLIQCSFVRCFYNHCMVCASVHQDNPWTLANELSPCRRIYYTIAYLCAIVHIGIISMKGVPFTSDSHWRKKIKGYTLHIV